MSKLLKIFQRNLSEALKEWGTKKTVLEKTGLSSGSLFGYLNGTYIPGLDKLELIADALGKEPWEMLIDKKAKPTKKLSELAHKIVIDEIDKLRLK